jgi:hypothetical protein
MPRRQPDKGQDTRAPRPERTKPERRMPVRQIEEEALQLRQSGASYSAIARRLELRRATDAHSAFIRAVRTRDGEEQQRLVADENMRIDQLELRIRERDAGQPDKVERRLLAAASLRSALP